MIRGIVLGILGLFLLLCGGFACATQSMAPPVTTARGYVVAFEVSNRQLWLGPQALGDPRPNMATLSVTVRDQQGQRVDGIPVEFTVEPSWNNLVTITPPSTRTQAGVARALFEPRLTGVVPLMAQVDGQTYKTRTSVSVRNFGNSSR
jgi:hypothetical protein